MANVQKYNRGSIGTMTRHYERAKNESGEYLKFGNQDIDTQQSHLNYNLAPAHNQLKFIKKRTSQVKCLNRENVNVMCSWIVTAPKSIVENPELENIFFKEAYDFLSDKYGEENIISAYVHKDEKTPHMHFAFVPVVMDKKKNIEKVSAKELLTKTHLKSFHGELERHMSKAFGFDVGILNDATKNGNLEIIQLKQQTALKQLEEAQKQLDDVQSNIMSLAKQEHQIQKKISGLTLRIDELADIQPEKTITGAIKNVTLDDIEKLKTTALKYHSAVSKIKELERKVSALNAQIPTMQERMNQGKIAQENLELKRQIKKYQKFIDSIPEEQFQLLKKEYQKEEPKPEKAMDFGMDR